MGDGREADVKLSEEDDEKVLGMHMLDGRMMRRCWGCICWMGYVPMSISMIFNLYLKNLKILF